MLALWWFAMSKPQWNWEKGATFVVALLAWLSAELLSQRSPPHPHDVALMDRLRARITPRVTRFLREHDFANNFRVEDVTPLFDFGREWTGSAFQFVDGALQRRLAALTAVVDAFGMDLAQFSYTVRGRDMLTTKTDRDMIEGARSELTLARVAEMNRKADMVVKAMDDLDRFALSRLRPGQ